MVRRRAALRVWQKSLFSLLLALDSDLAARTRARGPCGGPPFVADFARKLGGARGPLPAGFEQRRSFCGGRDGCRRRQTPPSVRFLGRKVYLAVTVVLVNALHHGPRPARLAALWAALGVEPAEGQAPQAAFRGGSLGSRTPPYRHQAGNL
jgi:hypothetical protein